MREVFQVRKQCDGGCMHAARATSRVAVGASGIRRVGIVWMCMR